MPPVRTIRNIFAELRKICQHPYLSAPELEDLEAPEVQQQKALIEASGKLAFLKLLLPKLKERGHRVLLFSQFKIALDRIEDFLYGEGYKFLRLDGDLQQAQRQKSIDAFNAPDSECFIFLLTTRAGGVGINLASADTVIVYDPDFNPHQDLQAISRSYRYGQTKKVLVFKLMTKNSVEERIIQKGKQKMVLDHLVVQQMDKENEEGDVDNMLLHGASALYDKTDEEGVAASDIRYTSKSVDELIDKVEADAEAEAQAMEEREKAAGTPTEDAEGGVPKPKETMSFAFAKIWEAGKDRLREMSDNEDEEEDANAWSHVMENVQKARQAAELAELGSRKRAREAAARATKNGYKTPHLYSDDGSDNNKKKMKKNKEKRKQTATSDAEFAFNPDDTESEDDDHTAIQESSDLLDQDGRPRVSMVNGANGAALSAADAAKLKLVQDRANAIIRAATDNSPSSTIPGPTTASIDAKIAAKRAKKEAKANRQRQVIEHSKNNIVIPAQTPIGSHPSSGNLAKKRSPIVDVARMQQAQHVCQWLYHVLSNIGRRVELDTWATMALPEVPAARRKELYNELARIADDEMYKRGQYHYFGLPQTINTVSALFDCGGNIIPDDDGSLPKLLMPPQPPTLGVPRTNYLSQQQQTRQPVQATRPAHSVPAIQPHVQLIPPEQASLQPAVPIKQYDQHLPTPYASPKAAPVVLKQENIAAPARPSPQAGSSPLTDAPPAFASPSKVVQRVTTSVSAPKCPWCGYGHYLSDCKEAPTPASLVQQRIEIQTRDESDPSRAEALAMVDNMERLHEQEKLRLASLIDVQAAQRPTPARRAAPSTSTHSGTKYDAIVVDDDETDEEVPPSSAKRQKTTPSKRPSVPDGCVVCGSSKMHSIISCPVVTAGPESIKRALGRFEAGGQIWKLLNSLYAKAAASKTPSKSTSKFCPFCGATCGRTVRECATAMAGGNQGAGRKTLKGLIRELEKTPRRPGLEELFDAYLAWPK